MPLPADFWVDGWERIKLPHLFPDPEVLTQANNADWVWNQLTTLPNALVDIIQGPINLSGDPTEAPSENLGYLLGKQTSNPDVQLRVNIIYPLGNGNVTEPPVSDVILPSYGITERQYPKYKAPFYRLFNPTIDWWIRADGPSGTLTYDLFHVQPIAFKGTVTEVIGALLMYAGVDPDQIYQDSFDWCYDEDVSVGEDNANRPIVWVIPSQGESIIDTIKRVLLHWSHVFSWGLNGEIWMLPANSPDVPTVQPSMDDNIKGVTIETDLSKLVNRCNAMHGAFSKVWDESDWTSPAPYKNSQWEPRLKSDYLGAYIDQYENIESQNKFGLRVLGDRIRGTGVPQSVPQWAFSNPSLGIAWRNVDIVTEGEDISVLAFPLFLLKSIKDLTMAMFYSNEAEPRRVGVLTQDLLGLDQDIGVIMSLVGYQGELVRAKVVRQDVDYNSLTVRTYFIELYATQFPGASTVIWNYINPDIAPVGTTDLQRAGNTMTLTIDLSTEAGLDWWYQIAISREGGPYEQITAGWTAVTGNLQHIEIWGYRTDLVDVLIRGADDDGSGGQSVPTPWVAMPSATSG